MILVACMVKNEADRFLSEALEAWREFTDHILILDDNSTDNTVDMCMRFGCEVYSWDAEAAWGNESGPRQELWRLAMASTEPGDWIFILDADMVPASSPLKLTESEHIESWAFSLYDLWGEDSDTLLYRDDAFWQAHLCPRVWLIKRPVDQEWQWNERGIHCGHFPTNLTFGATGFAPIRYSLLHYGYFTPEIRAEKLERYRSVSSQLSPQEIMHAESIAFPTPKLRRLPFTPDLTL